ncbi:MAG: hypothetical protein E6Z83_07015 [Pantoea sp.]|uniref:hypothetical protein n=1 Tax=Pantoea TaxID=53335 RepID=UPI001180D84E|nr:MULTISPECIES: hypothetical protein [Pantoea]MDU5780542.1 hypothetical protein [Pantoea sp.]
MKTQYHLEIYEPDMSDCVAGHFKSDAPFGALSVGDEINGIPLNTSSSHKNLRIITTKHMFCITEGSHMSHKICVRTDFSDK